MSWGGETKKKNAYTSSHEASLVLSLKGDQRSRVGGNVVK